MRLNDLELGELFSIDVRSADTIPFAPEMAPGCEVMLEYGVSDSEVLLRFGPRMWSVEGASSQQHQDLLGILRDYPGRLCWVTDCQSRDQDKWQLGIQVHGFVSLLRWSNLQIGVDEKLVHEIRRRHLSNAAGIPDACLWLTEEILMPSPDGNGSSRIVVLGEGKNEPFTIHGRNIVVDVQVHNDKLLAKAIRPARRNQQRRPTILVEGEIAFQDASIIAILSTELRTQIEQESRRSEAYLNLWREYNRLERETVLRKAQQFGYMQYRQQPTPLPNGNWCFRIESSPENPRQIRTLRNARELGLEAAEQLPPEVVGIDSAATGNESKERESNDPRSAHFLGSFAGWNGTVLEIAPSSIDDVELRPPAEGFVYVSLHGSLSSLARRDQAQALISGRFEPMHLKLSAILLGVDMPVARRTVHAPLSKETQKLFKGTPTARQEEALRIALNTPDLALIQGPPGTGKTQVIAALNTRLAEITKDRLGISGTVLVSSFQHEAVRNAVAKINVLGLPAVKVGEKRGRDSQGGYGREASQWRKAKIEQIEATLHEPASIPRMEAEIQKLSIQYSLAPVPPAQAAVLLNDVLRIAAESLPVELRDEISDEVIRLRQFNSQAFDGSEETPAYCHAGSTRTANRLNRL